MIDATVEAIEAGRPVVLPTDTVYGLAATPHREEPVRELARLKGRDPERPIALLAVDLARLLELVPELDERAVAVARALLPGPFTLVLANPGRRFPWLTPGRPETIGVRVPVLPEPAALVLRRVGAVAATSANATGGPDPRRVEDVPEALRRAVAVVVDAGELPGTPSTVVDCTGAEPRVLREGAVPAAETIARVRQALG
jgi:L-threonylcarbamoyladenylate synthase